MPERIQLSRRRGWRKPENTVLVSRPGRYGNPFQWKDVVTSEEGKEVSPAEARAQVVTQFAETLGTIPGYPSLETARAELAGKNLACWCPLEEPCHADILLTVVNSQQDTSEKGEQDD